MRNFAEQNVAEPGSAPEEVSVDRDATHRVHELLRSARYEILPTPTITEKVFAHTHPGQRITITASASLGLEATVSVAEQLQREGWQAVPHLAARMISSRNQLQEILDRLQAAGISEIFVPGGDATPPAGDYAQALDLLRDVAERGAPFKEVGIAGYPEPHPVIAREVLDHALEAKSALSTNIVSNLCFDPRSISRWVSELRSRGVVIPILLGVPGRVQLTKLAAVSAAIGVGESAKFLRRNTATFARLARPDGYAPQKLVSRVLRSIPEGVDGVAGLHIYTFNQIAKTEQWRSELLSQAT